MTDPSHQTPPLETLAPLGRAIRQLRAEIENVTGAPFSGIRDGVPTLWGDRGWRAKALGWTGRPVLAVAPGPLLSPYDSPAMGMASLRVTLDGRPFGGRGIEAGFARVLRERRLDGSEDDASLARRFGEGVHYFDPWTRRPIGAREALERVAWLRERFAGNDRRVVLVGISRWKRPVIDVFAAAPKGPPIHTMTAEDAIKAAVRHDARVMVWATRMPEPLPALCAEAGLPLARIEDGFLRSVGLGASLKLGASIVVDEDGIYYDPRVDSGLTRILRETAFTPELTRRAGNLRETIVARRLSKYNVGLSLAPEDWPADRRIVLVPGQVEDDASVRYGSPHVRSNRALLQAVRARNPDAFLLYKPHPDVEAGFRPGKVPEDVALGLADRIVGGLSIVDLLDRVHRVETMTSLTGFEALLRGLTVATHGKPFYAGWGLTEDLSPDASRGRALALDELVAGTLILYARYIDPVAMKPCEPEQLLDRLSAEREAASSSPLSLNGLQHLAMRARYAVLNPIVRRLRARRGVGGGSNRARR